MNNNPEIPVEEIFTNAMCFGFANYERARLREVAALLLERERGGWIPVDEWEANPANQAVNVMTWRSAFEEEFPIAYFFHGLWNLWGNDITGMPGRNIPKPEFVKPLPAPPATEAGA